MSPDTKLHTRMSPDTKLHSQTFTTCLRRWHALPLRSPTRRWRAFSLARNSTISLDPNLPGSLDVDSKLFSKVKIDSIEDLSKIRSSRPPPPPPKSIILNNFAFSPAAVSAVSPCSAASFEVNSESHTGARPSARLCVRQIGQDKHRFKIAFINRESAIS